MKLKFVDFWPGFDPEKDPIFGETLSQNFQIEYVKEDPDILIFSVFGYEHFKYRKAIKVFYSGENYFLYQYPALQGKSNPWEFADYVISHFHYDTPKSLVMPNWVRKYGFEYFETLEKRITSKKSKFATFIQGNCGNQFRNNFVRELSKYKKVDCPGSCMNNMSPIGATKEAKIDFCKDYKFVFAFENSSTKGYNTEKVIEPYLSGSIGLYWGDPEIGKIFNTRSMINYHDHSSTEDMIKRIIEVDENEDLFYSILNEKIFQNDSILSKDKFLEFIKLVFTK